MKYFFPKMSAYVAVIWFGAWACCGACQQLPGSSTTEVIVEIDREAALADWAPEGDLPEAAFTAALKTMAEIYRNRLEAMGIEVLEIRPVSGARQLMIRYAGDWEMDQIGGFFQRQGQLSFYETHDYQTAFAVIETVNETLRKAQGIVDTPALKPPDLQTFDSFSEALAADEAFAEYPEEAYRLANPLFALLIPPRYENFDADSRTPLVGYGHPKDIPQIDQYLNDSPASTIIPSDMAFLWTIEPFSSESSFFELIAIKLDNQAQRLGNAHIAAVTVDEEDASGRAKLTLTFTPEGAQILTDMTTAMVGKHLAITLDLEVYVYPVVNAPIRGRSTDILGNFDLTDARAIAAFLENDPLPFPVRIVRFELLSPK